MAKAMQITQLPNFPPVFGRWLNGKANVMFDIPTIRMTMSSDNVYTIDFRSPQRTYTYAMGFAVKNDKSILDAISPRLTVKFDGVFTENKYAPSLDDTDYVVVGYIFPVNGVNHTLEFYWDGVLFFIYTVTFVS